MVRRQIASVLLLAALFATLVLVMRPQDARPAAAPPRVELLCGPTKSYRLVCIVVVTTPSGRWCGIGPYVQSPNAMDLLASVQLHACAAKRQGPAS